MSDMSKTDLLILLITFVLLVLSFAIFFYFFCIIFNIFLTTPHLRETARYVLFIHMLVTDTLQVSVSLFLFLGHFFSFHVPIILCYVLSAFAYSAFRVTPYNLAIMSIERHVAICNPLRHSNTCNNHWCNSMIAVMWTLGFIPVVVDFIAMNFSVNSDFYSLYVACSWLFFSRNQAQSIIRLLVVSISFAVVGLIIFYTYINVMLVARKIGSDKSSASKAGKTVFLHAFQLSLCFLVL
ncbi:odorant receptor 131-2-like [Hyperolius riggenbachi]|uniref:odorant receptor 131-2-like n=1 Tax=Hyperolius riggenbachi TaxID=752182 RepID=UPI0035A337E9